jgi:glycerate dehydrogenase
MKIVVLDWRTMTMNDDLSPDILKQFGDVTVYPLTKPEDAAGRIADADAVLCNKVPITRDVMEKCPNLRYIGLFATGYNNVDIEFATSRKITVCNAGQYSTNAVAQQVFAYILDFYSRINDYNTLVSKGEWESSEIFSYFPIPTHELSGKTLSIVGYGSIGKAVAKIGEAFGMRILISTRTAPTDCEYELTDLDTAAANADILTIHCPLTDKTQGMVNARLLSEMKPSAVLVNTSRGGVVVEADLADALGSGKIAAAYLDVLGCEPMSPQTPLKSAKNCVITPHTAWAAHETRSRLLQIVCDNMAAWLNGSPQNKVN